MDAEERTLQDLFDLSGRVAIVTGACGWLGSAMSRALAEAGAYITGQNILVDGGWTAW